MVICALLGLLIMRGGGKEEKEQGGHNQPEAYLPRDGPIPPGEKGRGKGKKKSLHKPAEKEEKEGGGKKGQGSVRACKSVPFGERIEKEKKRGRRGTKHLRSESPRANKSSCSKEGGGKKTALRKNTGRGRGGGKKKEVRGVFLPICFRKEERPNCNCVPY